MSQRCHEPSFSPNGRYGIFGRDRVGSLRLDAGRANDLGTLVSFMGDQLAEFGGRKHKRRASQFGESRLYFEIGEASVDLLVENADDLGRRVPRLLRARR